MTTLTTEEIMFMAMKSGCPKENALANMDILEAFAKLVAEAAASKEREACAKVCEDIYTNGDGAECWLENAAKKIRARGTTE